MIDFKEITDFEIFEDLCEELLLAKGLKIRRLGRGPAQLGKDMIATESYVGSMSNDVIKKWLVEVKFTDGKRALNEGDVPNILDRVTSQKASGYLLFTNARLGVNLERTLNKLNENSPIDVITWKANKIEEEIFNYPQIFRKFFPVTHKKLMCENHMFFITQSKLCKSPLSYTLASLKLIRGLMEKDHDKELIGLEIEKLMKVVRSLIDEVDDSCSNFDSD
jgi:hypothetical protein